ncbi:MAG: valine--tRNA ligase [Odoribacteraceae bacterium]|jgi:valyl-tRNA synthetase|nr:valine--tRNA ligase [Odoribacteraceae bacterium]
MAYDPRTSEEKWYRYWMERGFFHSTVDRTKTPYCVVIPPPNVTGVLHMGHMLNNTLQDVLVRRARLQGKNACWVPGTDHASIATEAKVVAMLKSRGVEKKDISRDAFIEHAWEWTRKYGGIILEQLKRLGASCDWERTAFTMDETRSASVIRVFIDLHEKGLIYKGVRMVNWDPAAKTAVSDEEVIYREEQSKLYYVRYRIQESDSDYITVATTRPETILGDAAVCVNPNDERFFHLRGKHCIVPLLGRVIPIIQDEYVDMEFGTGALKITPAHDVNDYEIGYRHRLDVIDIFNDDGTLNDNAGLFIGLDRFDARQQIIPALQAAGNLVKIEDYANKIGYSERTDVVIEPRLSMQWFLKMKELVKPALAAVMNDDVLLVPAKYKNTYRHWMENVKDWNISRQLWWGHRVPAYYLPGSNDFIAARSAEEAAAVASEKLGLRVDPADLRQDEDCLDTWFSSWLWPLSVFNGILDPDNEEINYYYPTQDLVSAPDILFFWIARMIIAGYEFRGAKPFSNVYLTGLVRDKQHRKMSKTLGNSPDPLDLIDKYGADGVRVGMLLCSPAGGDLLFDESLPEQGRNFTTKIWNAFQLVSNWQTADVPQPEHARLALLWFENYLNEHLRTLDAQFAQYRLSEALMTVYTGFRDEFSSWLLEIIKPARGIPVDRATRDACISLFERLLQLLHPFMPFVTEEIWQQLGQRQEGDSIMISRLPTPGPVDNALLQEFERAKGVIVAVRGLRAEHNIPFREALELKVKHHPRHPRRLESVLLKMGNLSTVEEIDAPPPGSWSFIADTVEYFVPAAGEVNVDAAKEKLRGELDYAKGFLASVMKKLTNEKFIQGAPPAVIENERRKEADALAKIRAIEEQLARLD